MMSTFVGFCLRNRACVLIVGIVLTLLSTWVIGKLPVDVFPELYVPRVTIQTEAGGLSAEEVEQYVSIPLESAMSGAAGVKEVRSSSGSGLSFVWVDFDWNTDIYKARQIVSERLSTVRSKLPEKVEMELAPIVSVTGEIMLIALTSDNRTDALELRRMAEFQLRNRLMSLSGVGQVSVLGGRMPEYQILYNPDKMRQAGITLQDLKNTVENAQSTLPAGYLEDVAGQEIPIQQQSRAFTPEDIKRTLVPNHPSEVLRLEDIAQVHIGGAPRRGNAGYMGQDAVILSVQKIPGANTMQLTQEVDKMLADFSASQLPEGVQLHANAYRQSDFITLSLENGQKTLLIAAIIVILVIVLTLLNIRTALITLISMPLSVMLAMSCFPLFGLAINIMTLGGLAVAVGDVVDNTIIFVEVAWRALKRNAALPEQEQLSRYQVIMGAKDEIANSMGSSSLIILLVFVPLLFLGGMEGQFYRPLGISYMLALVASLIVALSLIPVLCLILFKAKPATKAEQASDSRTALLIKKAYAPVLDFCLRFPKSIFGALLSLTAAALWLASSFGTSFLPPFNEDCYTVFVNAVPGTSLAETERVSGQVMSEIQKIDGVKSVAQRTGRAENDEHAEPVSASELLVRVDLTRDQKRIRKEIRAILDKMPGMSGMIGYPLAHRISSALSGSNSEIAINIYGNELAQLRAAAKKAEEILSHMPEVADARANREVMVETLRIVYNKEKLAAYGLSIAEAAEQVSTAFNGQKMGEIIKNLDRWDIVLRLAPEMRQSLDDVRQLQLVATAGKTVTLDEIAEVYREESTNLVLRDNTMRKAMISCNPAADSNIGDLAEACRQQLDPVMREMGCTVDYAGTIKSREEAQTRLLLFGGIGLILIIMILSSSLGSFPRAMLTLVNIPLCLVGGIIAVFLASSDTLASLGTGHYVPPILSVSSIIGFVTVIGFAIRSALILLNRYRNLEEKGKSPEAAIREGSLERVIPIIMTSLTTILGLLPLILAKNQPGGELLAPLAIVQFGGLLSATLLNLLIIPASCKIFTRSTQKSQ